MSAPYRESADMPSKCEDCGCHKPPPVLPEYREACPACGYDRWTKTVLGHDGPHWFCTIKGLHLHRKCSAPSAFNYDHGCGLKWTCLPRRTR